MEKPICLTLSPAAADPEVKLESLLCGILASLDHGDVTEAEEERLRGRGSDMECLVCDAAPQLCLNNPAAMLNHRVCAHAFL